MNSLGASRNGASFFLILVVFVAATLDHFVSLHISVRELETIIETEVYRPDSIPSTHPSWRKLCRTHHTDRASQPSVSSCASSGHDSA